MDETADIPTTADSAALHTANSTRAAFDSTLSDLDVILTYSAPGTAPKGLDSTGGARFNSLWTVLGRHASMQPLKLQRTAYLSECKSSRPSARMPKHSPPRGSSKAHCGAEVHLACKLSL